MKKKNLKTPKGGSQSAPQIDAVLEILANHGMIPDQNIASKDAQSRIQEKRQRMYHNTSLLLKNYRDIKWILECFPDEVAAELETPFTTVDALLTAMDLEMSLGNSKLEGRLKSMNKSRLMIDRLNDALSVLRKKPGNGEALYQVIYYSFLCPEELSSEAVLNKLGLSTRHYYRMRGEAITILSIRLWSAPNGALDTWLDILTLLESN